MSITLDQAIAALNDVNYQTLDGLKQLVKLISVEIQNQTPNAVTLLYSGNVGDLPAWQIANQIAEVSGGKVITIGQTPVAQFIESIEFKDALQQAAGTNDPIVLKSLLDGTTNPDGTRTQGMWDIASQNLAEAATGDVRTISPFAESGKVFAATELPTLLNNDVATLNRTHFLKYSQKKCESK